MEPGRDVLATGLCIGFIAMFGCILFFIGGLICLVNVSVLQDQPTQCTTLAHLPESCEHEVQLFQPLINISYSTEDRGNLTSLLRLTRDCLNPIELESVWERLPINGSFSCFYQSSNPFRVFTGAEHAKNRRTFRAGFGVWLAGCSLLGCFGIALSALYMHNKWTTNNSDE